MSLINQMLRDLETRRSDPAHEAAALYGGLGATDSGRRRGRQRMLLLGLLALCVLLAAAILLWRSTAIPTAPPVVASAPQPASPLHPPVAEPPRSAPATPSEPGKAEAAPTEPRPLVAARAAEPRTPVETPQAPEPSATLPKAETAEPPPAKPLLQKRMRPLSPQQRAARAYQTALSNLQAGRTTAAEQSLHEALEHDPDHPAAREALVGLMLKSGRLVEAGELLSRGLQRQPQQTRLAVLLARVRLEQQNTAAAIAVLEQHADYARNDAGYLAFLAALYQRAGRYAESAERYHRALGLNSQQGQWWLGLGISLEGMHSPAQAAEAYRKAQAQGLTPALGDYARQRLEALGAHAAEQGPASEPTLP